ncbi:3-oxoacyl-[acyl-carrier-protein] synthase 3 [Striga asiatica]|uniref:3-oxoacyl-[acyl-carrier-protein] synthase 3 n=1 Tax=Striga asiatica TaxID=4170 RepID=A0A5A7PWL0_STRAF|nr:3-oxoacyl-[acyl-carrier-protein] synthase 3 [Striga asiatica]
MISASVTMNVREAFLVKSSVIGQRAVLELGVQCPRYGGSIGHLDRGCPKKMEDIVNNSMKEGQYGDWLKAADGQRWAPGNVSGSRSSPPRESPSMAENTTAQGASSSQTGNNQQRFQSQEDIPSLVKSVAATSFVSANKVPTPREEMVENNLQLVESSVMEPPLIIDQLVRGKRVRVDNETDERSKEPLLQIRFNLKNSKLSPKGRLCGPSTISQIRELLRTHHPNFLFLSETKKQNAFVKSVCKILGYDSKLAIVDPSDKRSSMGIHAHRQIALGSPLVSIGDWNDLMSHNEKAGGNSRNMTSFQGFHNFINAMEMSKVKFEGYTYTCCNNRAVPHLVEEKLDRAVGSLD